MKMLKKLGFAITLLMIFAGAALADLAVVVHADSGLTDISLRDLERIYLGKMTVLPDGENALLVGVEPLSDDFNRQALDLSTLQVRRHWIKVLFGGGRVTPPQLFEESDAALSFVADELGAIGYVDAKFANAGVKILSVDGLRPGQPGYALATR